MGVRLGLGLGLGLGMHMHMHNRYDAVVVATEALAVQHVLAEADPVFATVGRKFIVST